MAIIALVGKTASGKDTIARYITETYHIPQVVSYTTRPIRPSEQDGREHYFISEEKMAELVADDKNLFAYVKFPETGYEYCASLDKDEQAQDWVYIIDPVGIQYMKEKHPEMDVVAIYVDLPEEEILKRAAGRGDSPEAVRARLDSEREMMDDYHKGGGWDAVIRNTMPLESVLRKVDTVLDVMLNQEPEEAIGGMDEPEMECL
jgi:guanylate kinase